MGSESNTLIIWPHNPSCLLSGNFGYQKILSKVDFIGYFWGENEVRGTLTIGKLARDVLGVVQAVDNLAPS